MDLSPALTVKSSCLPIQVNIDHLVSVYWLEQNFFCCSAFQALIQKILFSVLFFLWPVVGVCLSLENSEEEAEKLIYCYISQEHTTLCNSFHPESSLDTLHSREIAASHSMKRG